MLIMMCCRRFSVTCTSGSRSQRVVAPDCQIARREHFHHRRPGAAEAVRSLADSPAGRHPPEGLAVAPARELAARLHRHEAVRWQRLAEGDERLEDGDALGQALQGSQGAIPTTRLVSVLGGTGVDATLCGHLPKFVARRVRSRLPPPPPSPADARTTGSLGLCSRFPRGILGVFSGLGKSAGQARRGRGDMAAGVGGNVSRAGFHGPDWAAARADVPALTDPTFRLIGSSKRWDRSAALTFTLHGFETALLTREENLVGLMALIRATARWLRRRRRQPPPGAGVNKKAEGVQRSGRPPAGRSASPTRRLSR